MTATVTPRSRRRRPFVHPLDGGEFHGPAKRALRWLLMPYGQWTCADGRVVLFNRRYCPLYQWRPGHAPEPIRAYERVRFDREAWFYSPHDSDADAMAASAAVLHAWGLPVPTTADLVQGER